MGHEQTFFLTDECKKFDAPGRVIARHVVEEFPEASPAPRPLVETVIKRIRSHRVVASDTGTRDRASDADAGDRESEAAATASAHRSRGRWFEGIAITVKSDDGMTWSAEKVAREVTVEYPTFTCWSVSRSKATLGLPVIASFVGKRVFLTLAGKRGLADRFFWWRAWHTLIIVALAIVVGTASRLLSLVKPGPEPQTVLDAVLSPAAVVPTLVVAILGVAAPFLQAWINGRTFLNALRTYVEREREPGQRASDVFALFVEDLAVELRRGPFPRLVVIDKYQTLDLTTQDVIDRYFADHVRERNGSEVWVVFEESVGPLFAKKVLECRKPETPHGCGYEGTSLWAQTLLTRAERTELLRTLGRDEAENAGVVVVKLLK